MAFMMDALCTTSTFTPRLCARRTKSECVVALPSGARRRHRIGSVRLCCCKTNKAIQVAAIGKTFCSGE